MNRLPLMLTALLSLALVIAACAPSGRVKNDDEATIVGSRKAGIEVFDQLVQETSNKLLSRQASKSREEGKLVIAFVGIENKSAEEIADARESSYDMIQSILVNSDVFTLLSRRFVEATLRESGVNRPEALFTQNGVDRFVENLRAKGMAPDYLLWGNFTSSTSQAEGVRERNYFLTLELVDAETGITESSESARIRKEYEE